MKKVDVPSGGEQINQTPKSSLNKTDEDKVKDEIKELRENHLRLERVCHVIACLMFLYPVNIHFQIMGGGCL